MSLIVENGTIVTGAESYCTVAYADTYHANRGNESWDNVDNKEAALRKATDYMGQTYRMMWKGQRINAVQALDWPRSGVTLDDSSWLKSDYAVASNIVPVEVMNACCELALRAAAGELLSDIDPEVASEKVSSIEVHYFKGSSKIKKYPAIDRLLAAFTTGSGMIRIARA